ncbi:MAG: winged helix-turn-helix domain-containing protein [Gemmatimonadales bacterium]
MPGRTKKNASLFIRVEFPGGDRFGPGKAALLAAVAETGSIAEAARRLRMSYRRAWLLIDSTNHLFGRPVVSAAPGGRAGGGAALTPFGRRLLDRYRRMLERIDRAARADLGQLRRWATGS